MRAVIAAVVFSLLVSVSAQAETNMSGAWAYIAKGSTWSTNDLPDNFSLTIDMKFTQDKVVYSSVNDTDKAKVGRLDFVAPLDGSVVSIANQARYNQVSVKRTGPNDLEIIQYKDGDVIVASFYTFLPDGKTFVRRGVGKSLEGKSKAYQEYFVRK